eukprot:CAMPEP_0169129026 /NCGR_PEP_ID=MMETSP1015-20121227/36900_1 /TAXON_ID=342587 /ORGANISM="Karlodinium micrum, Strain CCMP2283" /LENGTH=100 /DNA_ID=CAMNT_0009193005 /DNA_START=180 /DNA_END=482 /DNA_ORIENTATION=+
MTNGTSSDVYKLKSSTVKTTCAIPIVGSNGSKDIGGKPAPPKARPGFETFTTGICIAPYVNQYLPIMFLVLSTSSPKNARVQVPLVAGASYGNAGTRSKG